MYLFSLQLREIMLSKHGCTVPWMPDPIICTPDNLNGTIEDVLATYRVIFKSGKILDLCQQPCKTMKFVFGWPDVANDQGCTKFVKIFSHFVNDNNFLQERERGYVRIYFGVRIVVKRSVLDYTWLSAVAELGGYVGLLLGVAVVDIAFAADRYWPKISNLFKSDKGIKKAF